jgi:Na+-driven multidrug efflux pump
MTATSGAMLQLSTKAAAASTRLRAMISDIPGRRCERQGTGRLTREGRVDMTRGPLLAVVMRVAGPIVLSNLLIAGYQVVNGFWVGGLGSEAIAAVAASGPMFYVLVSLGSGLATAGSVLIAQYEGARRDAGVDHIAAQTLLMVAGVALCFAGLGLLSARPVLRAIGIEPRLQTLTAHYLSIAASAWSRCLASWPSGHAAGRRRGALRLSRDARSVIINALLIRSSSTRLAGAWRAQPSRR